MKAMTQESSLTTPRLLGLRTLKGALQRLSVTMFLMLLTTATAWADVVTYIGANGQPTIAEEVFPLDGLGFSLGQEGQETWYYVDNDITYDGIIECHGDVHIILADGKTINSGGNGINVHGSLTIYGQAKGTGTLNVTSDDQGIHSVSGFITICGGTVNVTGGTEGIHSDSGSITISGGRVTVTGENGTGISTISGTITLGWTTASDFIYASSYFIAGPQGSLKIAYGQKLYDEGGTEYSGTLSGITIPDGKTLCSFFPNVIAQYIDAAGKPARCAAIPLYGGGSSLGQDGQETWYYVDNDITYDGTIDCDGDVHIILADGKTMTINSGNNGIVVYDGGSLTIYGQAKGTGTLNATGFINGISTGSGNITICGGTVNATGDNNGIYTFSGDITISGGRVTVTSENNTGIYTEIGNITLGCTTVSDFIYASSYGVGDDATLKIADGQILYDEDGTEYSGTLTGITIPNGVTLCSFFPHVSAQYIDAAGKPARCAAIALGGTESTIGQYGQETWYYVDNDITYDGTIYCLGDVNIILADGKTMTINYGGYGIYVDDGSLTIYGQAKGTGTLNAISGNNGINSYSGDITICGGTVNATGDNAGISADSGIITISGGRVTATSSHGAGIYSGTITVSGGTVNATGDNAGISADSGIITISGGTVTATGSHGAGIKTNIGTITISGGTVTATGGYGIMINSGTVTLGCTTASDFIYASSYSVGDDATLKIADGQILYDEDGTEYSGTLSGITIPNGKTLCSFFPHVIAQYIDAAGKPARCAAIPLGGWEPSLGQDGQETWYYVGNDITYDRTIDCSGDVNIILADGKTLTITSNDGDGIDVNYGSLTIYGQELGTGTLNATGEDGEGIFTDSGTITICGGTVNVTGEDGEGIHSESGDITISGGRVTVTGDSEGIHSESGTITLGYTTDTDFIKVSSYIVLGETTLKIADGQTLFDQYGTPYSGMLSYDDIPNLDGATLRPIVPDHYDITVTVGENGHVSPDGMVSVPRGESLEFIITADPGYRIESVLVDGEPVAEFGNGDTEFFYMWPDVYADGTLEVTFTLLPTLTLLNDDSSQDADNKNSKLINDASDSGMPYNVTLQDRTLFKDGEWNTLCLPFDVTDGDPDDEISFSGTPLEGATVMVLDDSSDTGFDASTGVLTLNFSEETNIPAGTPFIIRWGTPDDNPGTTLTDPVFKGVTVQNSSNNVPFTGGAFKGTYAWQEYTQENKSILLLGAENTLYWPQPDGDTYPSIGAFRAYFELGGGQEAREFVLNFGEIETSLPQPLQREGSQAGAWFDLSGRKLSDKPTKKGVYIHGGRKVVIK